MYICERHQRDRRWAKRKADLHAVSQDTRQEGQTETEDRQQLEKVKKRKPSHLRTKEKWGSAMKYKDHNHIQLLKCTKGSSETQLAAANQ